MEKGLDYERRDYEWMSFGTTTKVRQKVLKLCVLNRATSLLPGGEKYPA
jgi:hypothetical protein